MMKGLIINQQQQQQQQQFMEAENMSNLTSASGDQASVSSGNRSADHYFAPPNQSTPPLKKKRNLPGNPDPDAEVIALSPKTLMATNRFICEICNKGFQRDQNLQLHRRGHNLPWKLKQRTSKEIRKKVYVCPEPSCVHNDPSRALGDLTGIKKHFCRKHGEKKWKCEKCTKRYAVQSDWKAHSKTCGTREYRCDCGTLFSRRDSFITHRAFCDALAEESARSITGNPILSSQAGTSSTVLSHNINLQVQPQIFNSHHLHHNDLNSFSNSLKKEQQNFSPRPDFPPWLAYPQPVMASGAGPPSPLDHHHHHLNPSSIFSTRSLDHQDFNQTHHNDLNLHHENTNPSQISNPNPSMGPTILPYNPTASPHMSATALLQKAAQMGATMSSSSSKACTSSPSPTMIVRPHHHQGHVSAVSGTSTKCTTGNFGLNLSSRDETTASGLVHGLPSFGNKAAGSGSGSGAPPASLFQDMMVSLSSATGFDGSSFEDAFGGMLNNSKKLDAHDIISPFHGMSDHDHDQAQAQVQAQASTGNGGNDGMTRDFLGLRALSHSDIMNIAGLGNCMNTHDHNLNQTQKPWQG